MEKLEKLLAWQVTNVISKREVIQEAQRDKKKVHFDTLMDICHLKNAELQPIFQTCKGSVVLRGDTGFVCITNEGCKSNGCSIRFYPSQDGGRSSMAETSTVRVVLIYGYVFHDTSGPKFLFNIVDQVVPRERNLYGYPLVGFRSILKKFYWKVGGRKVPNWECL